MAHKPSHHKGNIMATSQCPKCESTSFECVEAINVENLGHEHNFIQCASCGTVVGVLEKYNFGEKLQELMHKLGLPR